jgi:hypothetical protein
MGSFKCKSLFPILGSPSLAYVLHALKYIGCQKCFLCVERSDIHDQIEQVGRRSGISCVVFMDTGLGPTRVAQEAAAQVSSPRFLMLHGHQIVFPDYLARMCEQDVDFMATVYPNSSEGVRKIALLDANGRCIRVRRGSSSDLAGMDELYLDKPYVLKTNVICDSLSSRSEYDPETPVTGDLRHDTILRYTRNLLTMPATFRHEYHYDHELPEVEELAKVFRRDFSFEGAK